MGNKKKKKRNFDAEAKLLAMFDDIDSIIAYPPEGGRRTEDGYPLEVMYDEFAYKRMVDSYRQGLRNLLKTYGG